MLHLLQGLLKPQKLASLTDFIREIYGFPIDANLNPFKVRELYRRSTYKNGMILG